MPKDIRKRVDAFLEELDQVTLARGKDYFQRGLVKQLDCIRPRELYTALVIGGEPYEVALEFTEYESAGECTCPVGTDCKHIVAALMALRADGMATEPAERATVPAQPDSGATLSGPGPSLREELAKRLGRKLRSEEAATLRRIEELYRFADARGLTESDVRSLLPAPFVPGFSDPYRPYELVDLWPEFPANSYSFWLYLAWELRRRQHELPGFLEAVTDLSLIAPVMEVWARRKEIERWSQWFQDYGGQTPVSEPLILELRLMVAATEARLQWRTSSAASFQELKQAQAKRLAEQFENSALVVAPNSLPLWSASYKPWRYDTWWSFRYADTTALPSLNRLLRLPLPPETVVTAEGAPLDRVTEPLRLNLRPPENGSQVYALALTTGQGAPLPPVLCKLAGQPTLYLTERSLFQGPPAEALDEDLSVTIPTEALETTDGLRFLHANHLPLPEHLENRVTHVPVNVTVTCQLRPIYIGSDTEDLLIEVTAKAPGLTPEHFTSSGWQHPWNAKPPKSGKEDRGKLIIHDRTAQKHFPKLLDPLGARWENYPGGWKLRLTKKVPDVFAQWLRGLPQEIEVLLDKELASFRDAPVAGGVSLDLTEAGVDWFDLKVVLKVTDTTLTPEELKLLLNARGGFVRLGKKGWRRLQFNLTPEEDEQLARLGLTSTDFSAEPQRLHALQLADEAARKFLPPDRVEKIQRRASELKTRVTPELPRVISAELRPYQTEGFHFLAYLTSNRFGGVLADDMGLGKTIQTLAWLAWLQEEGNDAVRAQRAPSLVICPKSVMDNWRAETERFYPGLRVRLWRGEPEAELTTARKEFDLIVVNYSQLRSLWPAIGRMNWFAVILDEAQYIKNPDSQTAQAARGLKAEHRLALTGTPIENRLLDLWSILAFAMPGVLGNRAQFLKRFDAKDDPLARRRLAARVRPFLLRRTKGQVARDLPDRIEEDLLCEMEGTQQTLYRAELKRAQQMILGLKSNDQLNKQRFNILTSLLRLRQICCHPSLVDGSLLDAESAKLDALEDLLEPLMAEGHKVLVFSQFVTMLDLLQEKMEERDWPFFYLAGDTEDRGDLVKKFQTARGGAVFLISLKAGGFGLNLTAASYVVLFDPWWNPAVENQAIDRTHRIGQTSKVIAYRLLMRDSIEQKIRALQKEKAALADDVLGEERFSQSLTLNDLQFLFAD